MNDAASHFPCMRWVVGDYLFHLDFQQLGLTRYVVRSTGEKVVEASRFETSRRKRHDPDMYANRESKSCCAGRLRAYLCGGSGLSTYNKTHTVEATVLLSLQLSLWFFSFRLSLLPLRQPPTFGDDGPRLTMKSSIASLLIALTSATTSAYGLELKFQRRSVSVESQSTDNRFDLVKTLGGKDATLSSTSNVTNVQNTRASMALISFGLLSETSLVYDEHCVKWETWVSSWYIKLDPHQRSLEVLVALDTGSTDLWYDPLLLLPPSPVSNLSFPGLPRQLTSAPSMTLAYRWNFCMAMAHMVLAGRLALRHSSWEHTMYHSKVRSLSPTWDDSHSS